MLRQDSNPAHWHRMGEIASLVDESPAALEGKKAPCGLHGVDLSIPSTILMLLIQNVTPWQTLDEEHLRITGDIEASAPRWR